MDLTALPTLIAAGAGAAMPTKMAVDACKRAIPALPAWALLTLAVVFGETIVFLVRIVGNMEPTMANIAGCIIAGAAAAGGAIVGTELHKAARPDPALVDVLPELTEATAHDIAAMVREELDALAAPSVTVQAGSTRITRRGTPEQTEPLMPGRWTPGEAPSADLIDRIAPPRAPDALITRPPGWLAPPPPPTTSGTAAQPERRVWPPTDTAAEREGR